MYRQSLEAQRGNSANGTQDFLPEFQDMTAHWLVMDMLTLQHISSLYFLHLVLIEVSREEDMGMEASRSFALHIFLNWAH